MKIAVCDCCRKEIDDTPEYRIHLNVDRHMDGAGSMETDTECYELCKECQLEVYKLWAIHLLHKLTGERTNRYTLEENKEFDVIIRGSLPKGSNL